MENVLKVKSLCFTRDLTFLEASSILNILMHILIYQNIIILMYNFHYESVYQILNSLVPKYYLDNFQLLALHQTFQVFAIRQDLLIMKEL